MHLHLLVLNSTVHLVLLHPLLPGFCVGFISN